MTGDTTDVGAPPAMSRVYGYTVEYGPWTGCIQHARAHAIVVAAPSGGGRGLPGGPAGPGGPQSSACCPSQLEPALCTAGVMAGRVAVDRASTIFPEMGINSPHLGFTVPANNKVLITPTRDSPLWPPYFRQTAAGIPGRAPHRAPADFLPDR